MGKARSEWNEDEVIDAVTDHITGAFEDLGKDLCRRISSRTPRSPGPGHLPGGGHAADATAYEVSPIPDGVRLQVGYQGRAFYMAFSEIGTSQQAARPVVVPTVLEAKGDILSKLARG